MREDYFISVIMYRTSNGSGVTTNSATATNCVSLYDLEGIH